MTTQGLQLWGGVECTVNRVHGLYFDQLEHSGHPNRLSDLDLFAALGITALRQPVVWERTVRNRSTVDWTWTDRCLERLQQLKIRPIAGLVHHGSGPPFTSLLDPNFSKHLAAYAQQVATRYPWVCDYTPVNEPLTTARFSALYGHWYPHAHDDRSFVTALLNQCRATVEAMRAIRKINPSARLVQTDDLGKIFSTPRLRYQADFENERRWLSFDLLCGRVDRNHPLFDYLHNSGVSEAEILWFSENPCPPDIMGLNYYLTSERFLDDHLDLYRPALHGGNGRDLYVDVEAVRVRHEGIAGARELLREAWDRFHLPIAITECHNGCSREEQMRWFAETWVAAEQLRSEEVDIRAVTAWALLGSFDWNTLATRSTGFYEPGPFDLRSPSPRKTALAELISGLAAHHKPSHHLLAVPGWWRRPDRILNGFAVHEDGSVKPHNAPTNSLNAYSCRPLLISGAGGMLARSFERACAVRGIPARALSRQEMDIADRASVTRALDGLNPWAVINCAGYTGVESAETDGTRCHRENTVGAAVLASRCANRGVRLLTFSADQVFDGRKQSAYVENDSVNPLNQYGISKANAEREVFLRMPDALIIRTSECFGASGRHFLARALENLEHGMPFRAIRDWRFSPTYLPDLVNIALDLFIDGEHGIWHLSNSGDISWSEFALQAAELAGLDHQLVQACSASEIRPPAPRPVYSVLGSKRGNLMPSLADALARYVAERNNTTLAA